MNKNNLVGKRFGKLVILEYCWSKKSGGQTRRFYKAQCDCRKIAVVLGESVVQGRCKSCGCLRKRKGKDHPKWTGYGEISGNFWDNIKRKDRGFKFEISIQYIWSLFLKQKRKCALSGVDLFFNPKRTASLDRIDSNMGYLQGNVQWVHKDINIIKLDYPQDYFIQMCENIANYQKAKNVK